MNGPTLRLSVLAGLGLVCAIFAWIIFMAIAKPGGELAQIAALRRQLRPTSDSFAVTDNQIAAGLCTSGLSQAENDTRAHLQFAAAASNVTVAQLDLNAKAALATGRLSGDDVQLKARGSEPNLMQFIAAAAAEQPALIFDKVSLSRTAAAELQFDLDARLICANL